MPKYLLRSALLLFCSLFLLLPLRAQPDDNPVRWTAGVEETTPGQYRVTFDARIDEPWHLYDLGPYEGGPNATTFTFEPAEGIELVGSPYQLSQPTRVHDELFGMEIGYFAGEARFAQDVRLEEGVRGARLKAVVEWMVCDDQNCLAPTDREFTVTVGDAAAVSAAQEDGAVAAASAAGSGSLWGAIIEAILWGFAALLTPCVFPMVPMTVSFFMKSGGNKAKGRMMASFYGLSIVALYTLPIAVIILITRLVGGDTVTADIFNWLATHWLPNVIFFIVFMLFAASFFGAFEITMPSRLVNKSDQKADKGGLLGVFFMAMTLVLVSFSCTGPIVGSVLIKSTSGEVWAPVITMFAFSVAFALPFTLFAFFPSVLNNLPKSGGWLNSVKVVLGFLELALGLKFLSVADQTYHWGILDREVYLALWIVIFTLLGFYLLGKLRFKHDSRPEYIGVTRLALAIVTLSFVVYMIPGMWGAPLKALSGYMPPMHTQDFVLGQGTVSASPAAERPLSGEQPPKYSDFLHLPHGLSGFFDYDEAMAYARKVDKPVFLDYTGHGCVNCREMEARVWSDPRVLELLRDRYVILALYSDDKKTVPVSDWVTTDTGRVLKGLGKINAYFVHRRYGVNSQPYYLLLDHEGKPLVPGMSYNLDVDAYVRFLQSGLERFDAGR